MAIDVTVLGASGTTVTIPFTSATNAAAAQAALFGISKQVTGGTLTQVNYTGGSTVPSVSTPLGGVLGTGSVTGLAPVAIGGQYVSMVQGTSGDQSIFVNFGANNAIVASGAGGSTVGGTGTPTVVSGAGGAEIGNLGTNTQVFLGGAAIQNFSELGVGSALPSATVWVTTPLKGTATFDDSSGNTTINLDTVASTLTVAHPFGQTMVLLNSGNGQTTINVQSAQPGVVTDGDALSFRGTSTVATTVNAAGGANSLGAATGGVGMWALEKSGNVFINGNGSNVILFPTGPGVAATLFGGAGSDIDAGGGGLIKGGSAGGNVLFGSLVAGSTTLIGGGTGDVLVQQGAGNMMFAGAGNEQMYALPGTGHNTIGGAGVPGPHGLTGSSGPGTTTFMDAFNGGNTFITGNAASVDGGTTINSVNDTNGGNLFQEGVKNPGTGSGANSATINGFVSGTDSISLSNPAGGTYSLIGSSTVTSPGAGNVDFQTSGGNTQVNFGDGTTWTLMGVTLQNSDFH